MTLISSCCHPWTRVAYHPKKPEELVGTFRTFGVVGPIYEVLQIIEADTLRIVLVETGEEVDYSLHEALRDPEAK